MRLDLFALLSVLALTATATFTSQLDYWHEMLPKTPIPPAIRNRIPSTGDSVRFLGKMTLVPKPTALKYEYVSNEKAQVLDDNTIGLFFLEKDLIPGSKFNLGFIKTISGSHFIPYPLANSIPFSLSRLPQILNYFQVETSSITAEVMKATLTTCEAPAMLGENKLCATSLEAMVEFSMITLGTRDLHASSTTITHEKSSDALTKTTYMVAPSGVRQLSGEKFIACHAQPYLYTVFYCHSFGNDKGYSVTLEGDDGTKVNAVAICHFDTTNWNPKHIAFQLLKVKPGSQVCHFFPEDHVLWSINK